MEKIILKNELRVVRVLKKKLNFTKESHLSQRACNAGEKQNLHYTCKSMYFAWKFPPSFLRYSC